ncbi:MAG: AEC family transporter [Clostridia bacterium]|nr:AEC family transporter [Clostridia bacterium]
MKIILEQLLILYAFLLLGWILGKKNPRIIPQTGILSFLLVNLFLPAKVFGTFSRNFTVSYFSLNYRTILISVCFLIFFHFASKPLARLFYKEGYMIRVMEYTFTITNYAYMGYALAESVWGEKGLTDLIVFCIPFALYTYTVGYLKLTGSGKGLRRAINPMTVALLLGILFGLTAVPIPTSAQSVLTSASNCVGPLSMLLTGITLSEFPVKEMLTDKKAYGIILLRLVIIPGVIFGVIKLLQLPSHIALPALFVSAMPTGLNTIVFPKSVGEDPGPGARLAFLSHLASCVTIPLWLSLIA